MNQKKIIFHCPRDFNAKAVSASSIRPRAILGAFRESYEILEVIGSMPERAQRIDEAIARIKAGERFEFMYSELSVAPLNLSNGKKWLFLKYDKDRELFRACHKAGIPVGVFYRDAYWLFPDLFKGHPVGKYLYLNEYIRDLRFFKHHCTAMFGPSEKFCGLLAKKIDLPWYPLPAGTSEKAISIYKKKPGELRLLYVGGIGGHYDIRPVIAAVSGKTGVSLRIIARKAEADQLSEYIEGTANIIVANKDPEELEQEYNNADVCMMYFEPHKYLSIAMPYKLFEYIDHGKPIILHENLGAASFVEKYNAGWVLSSADELSPLLDRLRDEPGEVLRKAENAQRAKIDSTWRHRVRFVGEILSNRSKRGQIL
jgi:glycosyltransferase involved in cell wall biosynthesis